MIKRLRERELFKTKLFIIKDIDLQLENGQKVTYQIMEKSDTALIVPINSKGDLILVKEYFYAIDEYQYGLPKGRIEDNSDDLKTANKELQEEIGYRAGKLDKLGVLTMSPGYLTQRTHVFLARDLVPSKLDGDEPEELEIIEYPFKDFEKLIEDRKLTEARMIAALYLAKRFIR
ncbi:ADP compounds hydrolase NudE [Candidatus Daviesbacteria bacterium]|nr:ADP compounds hydrolase NudE [Candidatus Daviesbacteria bacterium]MBI4035331.1 ADP compounds hydrolase NudE [Candidatus Daviesbacteria bacterium]